MAAPNHAKIINALEALVSKDNTSEFIYDFLLAYGTPKATIKRLQAGDKQRNLSLIATDVAVPRSIYFRPLPKQVAGGFSVSGALEEVLAMPVLVKNKIRFVLVTDFVTVAAYDAKVKDTTIFDFAELPHRYDFFLPLTGKFEKSMEYAEHPADIKACEKMGRLYDSICTMNHYGKDERHILNVFLTRLLFCFFAEDTGIFPKASQMTLALQSMSQEDGSDLTSFFEQLFLALSLPIGSAERNNLANTFQEFPYVNGGLFQENVAIPTFNTKSRRLLMECGKMEWHEISPIIFGAMFQAVMDPEQRRSMGAHYTSEKNILKVIRPLFLDALHEEFQTIQEKKHGRKAALEAFHTKLSTLGFLDPACGCGNFLIVAYRELKELELQVVMALRGENADSSLWLNVSLSQFSKVTIDQFYGIEIEEFPVEVARVSMWLMEHVMNVRFGESLGCTFPSIPLSHAATIVCTNALTTPWENIVAPEKLNYIFGNPPFVGASMLTAAQKKEIVRLFQNKRLSASLDYVTGWYSITVNFIQSTSIEVAFVSTNSICQGEQVFPLWSCLLEHGCYINFAHRTFKWNNEAKNNAAVFCVVIGFSLKNRKNKILYHYDKVSNNPTELYARQISPYLLDTPSILVTSASSPVIAPIKMVYGNKPSDNGHLILSSEEYQKMLKEVPTASLFLKKYVGAEDFLNGGAKRYCLWLKGVNKHDWKDVPQIVSRVQAVAKFRLASSAKPTREKAQKAEEFFFAPHTGKPYLLVPSTTSERRNYIPIGFMGKDVVASNANLIVPEATLYHFGILTSAMHMAWMRTVCGRLKSDYRYSASIVYNTFPWPEATKTQEHTIEELAQEVLDIREMYPDMTLAQLYNPETMPKDLQEAHTTLDLAVDTLYQSKPFADDDARLQMLFARYAKLVENH
ncbi:MAG: DNA methyltransferase [Pseudomonadota bacterium]